ncbi:MAG TPA: pitrilysin family protein, partial [Chitinophagales bacterium]
MRKLFIASTLFFMSQNQIQAQKAVTTPNDIFKVEEYTLSNGLKVFISPNTDAPRLQTMIAVKAGSKYDPAQTTGLAHYLEHMMFKGTSHYGTLDWTKEQAVLAQISNLFEAHLKEPDEAKKKAIYHEIDSLSYEASKYAIPSEYDKMVASIGASGTNAFTSNDMTVYVNDIPSNSLEKWAALESERFSELVLRLFHTELETVYEEFNRNQDADIRWSNQAVDEALMPNHPYGTQTTIGLGDHLKNPSMVNIHNYFNNYYVPNNIAVILSGDVKAKEVLPILEKTFGKLKAKDVPVFVKATPVELTKVQEKEVFGPTQEHVIIGYRFDGDGSKEALTARAVDMLLTNGAAGLIELNLKQKQKVLSVSTYVNALKDYSIFKLYAEPKQGQTLEEVRDLLLSQIELIKKGEFDEEMLKANIANMKLHRLQNVENNRARASEIMDAFVKDIPWKYRVTELDEMAKLTKKDIVDFANKYFGNNYAVAYKRMGEPNRHKVDKPTITPVVLNKDTASVFKKIFDEIPQGNIKAKFIDFNKDIAKTVLKNGGEFQYIKSEKAPLFSLSLVHNYGTDNNRYLSLAA